ncbi:Solute carrier family 23 member 2 [Bagarius yarrelli]|uniref:Solute carrier family 23 member 2 n=1 Tax=Bagarius yarrelli TaxID=175774 RepID=A0A556V2L8_BAGYA|nr:Solute carrier family 23 member 2 [Bagarius yarrelli]
MHLAQEDRTINSHPEEKISKESHMASNSIPAENKTAPVEENLNQRSGHNLVYSINDRPPWYLCLLLGFQHYILAFGGILAIPLILAEPLCIKDNNTAKSQLVSTIFFVSGICTMLQTTVGTRLPILQGGTFTFITPTLAILALPKWQCPKESMTSDLNVTVASVSRIDPEEVWKMRMREIQGAILVASLLQVVLGLSGLVGFVLKYIGPLAIAPTINLIGLSLFIQAGKKSGTHWGISALTVFLILLFSQYLSRVKVPLIAYRGRKWTVFRYPLFSLFSVLFGMSSAWLVCFLLTYLDVLPTLPNEYGYQARTDINLDAVSSAEWFFMPYPGQWGLPSVSISSVLGMMAGVLASTMESIGDYYACARLSGAPSPPTHAINRGIAVEGLGCILAGLWGSGNGTTSYSQNIAALGITRVGSRLVLQTAGLLMIVLGLFGKFSAVFITIPEPVIGGMFLVMFGMVAAVGISNLQHVDLNSSRNLLIFGISIFTGFIPTQTPSTRIWIRTCVHLLLYITVAAYSSEIGNPITDDIKKISLLKQNIPKDYKITVQYLPKEVSGMCWVKLNVFHLEESLKDLAQKFGNISSNKDYIETFIQMLQEMRYIIGQMDLEDSMLEFQCHYRQEKWLTPRYFQFLEDFFNTANLTKDVEDCEPPPCPITAKPTTETGTTTGTQTQRHSRDSSMNPRTFPEVMKRSLFSLLFIPVIAVVFLLVWKGEEEGEKEDEEEKKEGGLLWWFFLIGGLIGDGTGGKKPCKNHLKSVNSMQLSISVYSGTIANKRKESREGKKRLHLVLFPPASCLVEFSHSLCLSFVWVSY